MTVPNNCGDPAVAVLRSSLISLSWSRGDSHGLPAWKTMQTPQLQFFSGGRCPCCAGRVYVRVGRFRPRVLGEGDMPVVQDRFYGPDSAENCQVTQVQFLDKVICPLCARQVLWPRQCRRLSRYTGAVLGHGIMPVVVANSGSASDSALRLDLGTLLPATETGTHSANCAVSSCRSSTRLCSRTCRYAATGAHGPDSAALWMDWRLGQLIIGMLS